MVGLVPLASLLRGQGARVGHLVGLAGKASDPWVEDKEEVWREAGRCLDRLGGSEEEVERLRRLVTAHPWLRLRASFARRGVRRLLREERRGGGAGGEVCREVRRRLGDLPPPLGRGPRVLALDGGGMRGVVTLVLLQELERRTGRRLHQLFDLVVGTSTGALIAALLAVRGMDAAAALAVYRQLGTKVFQQSRLRGAQGLLANWSYYDDQELEAVLFRHFGAAAMEATLAAEAVPRLALVATDVSSRRLAPILFCNYLGPAGEHSVHRCAGGGATVVQALLASTAAPGYFPAVEVGLHLHLHLHLHLNLYLHPVVNHLYKAIHFVDRTFETLRRN